MNGRMVLTIKIKKKWRIEVPPASLSEAAPVQAAMLVLKEEPPTTEQFEVAAKKRRKMSSCTSNKLSDQDHSFTHKCTVRSVET